MKHIYKTALAVGLMALSCTCTSLAATAESLGAEMGQAGGFYTLYLGMPISDFRENWEDIAGWEHRRGSKSLGIWNEMYSRSYEVEGAAVKEEVSMRLDENRGCVRAFSWRLSSDSEEVIGKVFVDMYDRLALRYPGFTAKIPMGYTAVDGHKPFMALDAEGAASLGLYLAHGYGPDPNVPKYFITLVYKE